MLLQYAIRAPRHNKECYYSGRDRQHITFTTDVDEAYLFNDRRQAKKITNMFDRNEFQIVSRVQPTDDDLEIVEVEVTRVIP